MDKETREQDVVTNQKSTDVSYCVCRMFGSEANIERCGLVTDVAAGFGIHSSRFVIKVRVVRVSGRSF